MALRREDLAGNTGAVVVRFPVAVARARARRARRRYALRRLVVGLVLLGIPASVFLSGGGPTVPAGAGAGRTVVVQPGQTLWELAAAAAPPGSDPRAYVDAIVARNDLEGGLVEAGQRLELPR